ncbi:methylmalonyl-CoA mutase small subunit [Pseudonocardia sp. KRD-184]|uniref:Methylmalonyl-CoA mutase small subunit n=1 Tax=Pseudonocardia oceani TaxID=2792013 RepID=A0ABS6UI60_9PSEU|nr:methylmalonyl-CoA mutase family protein [Pseudonocardia oceani]MBW0093047.1 methylmalonyl-CoA mutase small subunit [Pseudonocardia oceani]MBW0099827.1 methylmalonyl-CoA mutase small subunit [Pseudonocardia oceani]MBW0112502.1 methylmalonyl-CoA mutase small subunit [Pseudonocardia oceani]MBW0125180.1 methylmalonyl-CoA mutase small subunit [Pseudonocardia oceani]MBW0131903.1 methylmalonyl-CoA mutase small subunit [Pseudonocardia oceani]
MPEAESSEVSVLPLAAEFPAATEAEWTALVDAVLRKAKRIGEDAPEGAGVEKLVRTSPDGIAVRPLYTEVPDAPVGVPGAAPFVRGATIDGPVPDGWDVRQRHTGTDADDLRAAVLADLENGVTSVWLDGVAPADLPHVLGDVLLDLAPVVLDAGAGDQAALAEAFLALAAERGTGEALLGTLGLDPVGLRARTGDGPAVDSVVALAERVAADHPLVRAVVVDALPVHTAGGSDAQELGFALAAGLEYLRVLEPLGVPTASRLLEFRLAASAEQFPTIAKLRAARRLWARVTEACGSPEPMATHAVASPTMYTRRDPYVNLLRGTLAGFSAGVGGADAVTVAPFDAALGAAQPFSRRIARNTQALLVEESHLARVIDPAGGSFYVESLTDGLARAAWAFFQEIEAAGGAVAALDSGFVAERTAEVRARRERDAATRKRPLTGVSEFPDLDEKPVEREPLPERPGGGLPVYRPAGAYEEFRDRSDAVLAETGSRPRAFLATLGPLAAYTARAGFTRNLLQAGGIEPVEAGPTETAADVSAAFTGAGTPVAVLCSTDRIYAERAAETVAALRDAGATHVLLAGKSDLEGLDGTLHAGCDALAVIDAVFENAGHQEGAR